MEIRQLAESDLPSLLDLCQRTLPLDRFSLPVLRHHMLNEPITCPAYQLSIWDGVRLVGAMVGGARDGQERPEAWVRLFAIDPADRRKGLATRLLAELERRLRADRYTRLFVGNSVPNYFWPGLDIRYTPGLCFLQKSGFRRSGDAINMHVDLLVRDWDTTDAEMRLGQAGFTIRRLLPSDREQFEAWLRDHWSAAWHYEALSSYANEPISTFVALADGRICAFASYNTTTFEHVFGPTGTEPALQGRGLGRVLFLRCMRDLKGMGHQSAEICWVGPIAFYAHVADAWISRTFWFLEKEL
jgi:GNAT superfamily N-acetyltransferase